MPRYRVTKLSFIHGSRVRPGAIIDYDGKPGSNLELIEDDKPKRGRRADVADSIPEAEGPAPSGE